MLQAVTYTNTFYVHPPTQPDTLVLSVFDGQLWSAAVSVLVSFQTINYPPVLTLAVAPVVDLFYEYGPGVSVVPNTTTLTDANDADLAGLNITASFAFTASEMLTIPVLSNCLTLVTTSNALMLTGACPVADYLAALLEVC